MGLNVQRIHKNLDIILLKTIKGEKTVCYVNRMEMKQNGVISFHQETEKKNEENCEQLDPEKL